MYSTKALLKMAISALSEVYDDFTVYGMCTRSTWFQLSQLMVSFRMDWTEDLPAITATRDFLQQHRQAAEITSLAKKAT